jgi:hypothetical protein
MLHDRGKLRTHRWEVAGREIWAGSATTAIRYQRMPN